MLTFLLVFQNLAFVNLVPQYSFLFVVILDVPIGILPFDSVPHFISLLGILRLLLYLFDFLGHLLRRVSNIPLSVDIGWRQLLNGILSVLFHLFFQLFLVVFLFVDVVVSADDWVVVVCLPVSFF